jgi:hypothetical protein
MAICAVTGGCRKSKDAIWSAATSGSQRRTGGRVNQGLSGMGYTIVIAIFSPFPNFLCAAAMADSAGRSVLRAGAGRR